MDVNYNRTLVELKNDQQAFVYFVNSKTAYDHSFVKPFKPLDPVTLNGINDVDDSDIDDSDSTTRDSEVVEVTKESRISVPQALLHKLNFKVGDVVYISLTDDEDKVFVHDGTAAFTKDAKLVINSDGRLRLSAAALSNKFGQNYTQYKCTEDSFVIEITPVDNS
jgi:hypothetical protein